MPHPPRYDGPIAPARPAMTDSAAPTTADAQLAQADAVHDTDPGRALALLRNLDAAALSPARQPRLAFLVDHVLGEKFALWGEALAELRALVRLAGDAVSPAVLRHAAVAAQVAGDAAHAATWTQALADAGAAPVAKARALVALGIVGFTAGRLAAGDAGRAALRALEPLDDLHAAPADGLDPAFGAVTNNLASDLLERPVEDLTDDALCHALQAAAAHAQRFWARAGTWLNHERAHYLVAMAANALGDGATGIAQARAGLALLDAHDTAGDEQVDRAFLELELAMGLRLAGQDGRGDALARALALAARFGNPDLDRWFAGRHTRNEALAVHYGK